MFKATANAPTFTDVLPFYHSAKCHKMRYKSIEVYRVCLS